MPPDPRAEAALDRINDDPAWAQRAYGATTVKRDIVVTWPKTRPLESYLQELQHARKEGLFINYRVARLPTWPDAWEHHGYSSWDYGAEFPRCFMVHSGFVRGWCLVMGTAEREKDEVQDWPAGRYIVRDPLWHPLAEPLPMPGFRGWRWFSLDQR